MASPSNGNGRNADAKRKLKQRLFGGRTTARCCFCRRALTFAMATLEHVQMVSAGGGWEIANLRLSCWTCNNERGTTEFEVFRQRMKERTARHDDTTNSP